jgi:hypothetical protein
MHVASNDGFFGKVYRQIMLVVSTKQQQITLGNGKFIGRTQIFGLSLTLIPASSLPPAYSRPTH